MRRLGRVHREECSATVARVLTVRDQQRFAGSSSGRRPRHCFGGVAFAVLCALTMGCNDSQRMVVGAEFVDHGSGSPYPRYEVWTSGIPTAEAQGRTYRISGLPPTEYDFRLVVRESGRAVRSPENWRKAWEAFDRCNVVGRVLIVEEDSKSGHWGFSGRLARDWTPAFGSSRPGFWAGQLNRMTLSKTVRLEIALSKMPCEMPTGIELAAVLLGGGRRE